jgi:hypothetical protein
MHHRMPPSKTAWSSLNVVIFPPFFPWSGYGLISALVHHITTILTVQGNKDLYEQHSNLIHQKNISLKCQHFVAVLRQLVKQYQKVHHMFEVHGGAVGLGTAIQARRLWVQFPIGTLGFFIDLILPATLWLWG